MPRPLARLDFVRLALLCLLWVSCASSRDVPDSGVADGGMRAVPTTITLANAGSAPFVVGNLCNGSFLSLEHDGERLQFDRSCACSCDDQSACGCPPSCAYTQQLIVPGDHASLEWDGLYARFAKPSCYVLAGLQRGDVVTANACWNESPGGEPFACADADFAYGVEREVTIRVEHHSAARTPVRIVLENQSTGPIEIVTDVCGAQDWFRLALDGKEGASLSAFCPCVCIGDFGPASCPVCGGCDETVVETVAPGATHAFEWSGMFWYAYPSGCSQQYAMPVGFQVSAEICFVRSGARTCQPLRFVLGESAEVRATVF